MRHIIIFIVYGVVMLFFTEQICVIMEDIIKIKRKRRSLNKYERRRLNVGMIMIMLYIFIIYCGFIDVVNLIGGI